MSQDRAKDYICSTSSTGRTTTVYGPADETDGACMGREVICVCRKPEIAQKIAALLNAAKETP